MPALGTLYLPAATAYAAVLLLLARRRRRPALGVLLGAFVLHAGFLAARAMALGAPSLNAVFEERVFLPFCLAAIALWLWGSLRNGEAAAVAVAAAVSALLALPLDKGVIPPSPKSASWLVPLFFSCEILAHALFIAAAALACRRRGESSLAPAHRLAVWGFVLFSAAQVSGAAWCYLGWSVPFQWSFRHLHSAALWCAYAAYIHLRFLPGWSERGRAAYLGAGALLLSAYLAALQFIEAGQLRIGG